MADWMKNSVETNVQTAIDSQTIQTALDRNTTALSDVAYQSFLTNAPIPRAFYYTTTATTVNAGTEPVISFTKGDATVFDPYSMLTTTNGVFRIPIDGFYTIVLNTSLPNNVVAGSIVASIRSVAGTYGANYVAMQGVATTATVENNYYCVTSLRPWRQGDTFEGAIFNNTTTNQTTLNQPVATNSIGICWVAPYQNYQGGQ